MAVKRPDYQKVNGRHGAPMGRHAPGSFDEALAVYLHQVPLSEGYDRGGAYWGVRPQGTTLWVAYQSNGWFEFHDMPNRMEHRAVQEAFKDLRPGAFFEGGH